tara:strand:- start:2 stop:763 length:762 start_codon:yes stop_codon:yes gene_type:complete
MKTKVKKITPIVEKKWEVKNRLYELSGDKKPLIYILRSKGILWFDEDKGYEREIKYCENQKTVFVDEMKGDGRMSHIIFRDGKLYVSKEKQTLQKLLSLYHPSKGTVYNEFDSVKIAKDDLVDLNVEIEALNAAKELDVDHAEAVLRVEQGSSVNTLTSKEIRRDIIIFAKSNPTLFLELAKDENVELRNFGIKAVEAGILTLSSDNRTFNWGKTKRKVMAVPFDEHPYSALAAFFKTDEGLEIYKNIEKRLK